jgi:hypothetical protein
MTIFINNDKTMKELAVKAFNYSGRKYKVVPQLNSQAIAKGRYY